MLLREIPSNLTGVKRSRRKVARMLMDKYPRINATERSLLLKRCSKGGWIAIICDSFEKVVLCDDRELWSIIASKVGVDEKCVQVFRNHNNPELWSLLLGSGQYQELSCLITDEIAGVDVKTMRLLAKHLDHKLIDKHILENDRYLAVRIEHCDKYDLDLRDVLVRADLDEDCLLALAPHLVPTLDAVSPILPCYHDLIAALLQMCDKDRPRVIEHFIAHHTSDSRNNMIWRTLAKRPCWNDQLMPVCLDEMRKCLDVQVLELLIRKQWPTVARHIALLFDILMGMEQPDASKLIARLSKHRECEELVPICTSLLLRHPEHNRAALDQSQGICWDFFRSPFPALEREKEAWGNVCG